LSGLGHHEGDGVLDAGDASYLPYDDLAEFLSVGVLDPGYEVVYAVYRVGLLDLGQRLQGSGYLFFGS